ncbi:hypothetical protein RFI_29671 [Reticulomyxa filosa]|uniref:Uncharacterized protein n=1 Tax=Reticulomyxa filosa TaxID=46433 RepID=X6M0M0_RETFI|nr:hypothetical protein RFI_29671 [Reticulomyxa filosa]|eukprot:ETO07723.1 hypothetical protein RFI_29671 [Reticulomyxa filosa]
MCIQPNKKAQRLSIENESINPLVTNEIKISLDNTEFFEEIDQTKYINILQIKDWNDGIFFFFPLFLLMQYFYFDIKVVGHTFALQHEIEEDCKSDSMNDKKKKSKFKLIREPSNSKDKNACKLRLCNQEYCRDIGYLSKGVVDTQLFLIPGIYETKETQLTLGSINQVRICTQITTDFVRHDATTLLRLCFQSLIDIAGNDTY